MFGAGTTIQPGLARPQSERRRGYIVMAYLGMAYIVMDSLRPQRQRHRDDNPDDSMPPPPIQHVYTHVYTYVYTHVCLYTSLYTCPRQQPGRVRSYIVMARYSYGPS